MLLRASIVLIRIKGAGSSSASMSAGTPGEGDRPYRGTVLSGARGDCPGEGGTVSRERGAIFGELGMVFRESGIGFVPAWGDPRRARAEPPGRGTALRG